MGLELLLLDFSLSRKVMKSSSMTSGSTGFLGLGFSLRASLIIASFKSLSRFSFCNAPTRISDDGFVETDVFPALENPVSQINSLFTRISSEFGLAVEPQLYRSEPTVFVIYVHCIIGILIRTAFFIIFIRPDFILI